jgi:hypothetical protein
MALREFTDRAGRGWRVWDVTADAIHPATRGEDYMRDYLDGWLAFESIDGLAKCRLTPIPPGWATATVAQLEQWLHKAETVRGDRASGPYGRSSAEVASNPRMPTDVRQPVRTFRFPGGRFWTVTECPASATTGADEAQPRRVLRFMSGSRALDLTSWPEDWASRSDADLADLLTASFPRHNAEEDDIAQRRRSSDADRR